MIALEICVDGHTTKSYICGNGRNSCNESELCCQLPFFTQINKTKSRYLNGSLFFIALELDRINVNTICQP